MIDPISWLLASLVKALTATMTVILQIVEVAMLYRPSIDEFAFYDELGGNTVATAIPLSRIILYGVFAFAIFLPAARGQVVPALVYAVIVTVATPYWYRMIAGLQQWSEDMVNGVLGMFGDTVTASVQEVQSGTAQLLQFSLNPMAGLDVMLACFMLMSAVMWGVVLIVIVWSYSVILHVVAAAGLFTLALLGLGGRVAQVFQAIVAVALVAIVFGIPVIVLIVETGIAFTTNDFWITATGGSAFATAFMVNITFIVAIGSQVGLVFVFYKATQKVMGKMNALIQGGELSARLMGRNLNNEKSHQESVSRGMSEPEKGLERENPNLIKDKGKADPTTSTNTSNESAVTDASTTAETATETSSTTAETASTTTTATEAGQAATTSASSTGAAASEGATVATEAAQGTAARQAAATGARVAATSAPSAAGAATGGAATAATTGAAATAAGGAATTGAAVAAGAPTAGVGTAVVLGGAAAIHTVKQVKEHHEEQREEKREEGS